jgi:hypothetical protein
MLQWRIPFFFTIFGVTFNYYSCLHKVTKWTNKQWTSSQLEVKKWMKFFNCPQKITCYNTYYMCFHGTRFSYFPNELEIILTKFMQVQVVKFPILISYFLCLNFQHIKYFRFVHVQKQNLKWQLESHNKKSTNLPLIIMLFWHHKW